MMSLYTDDIWSEFEEKIESRFKLKTYPHFDLFFDFPKKKNEIKKLVSDLSGKSISSHSFLPFVKIVIKTPRYKYQETEESLNINLTARDRKGFYSPETKKRPISFASHFDTYLYAFYSYSLNEKYQNYIKENGFGESVLAYRTDLDGKCNIQFAKETFDEVHRFFSKGSCTVIALDIKGYFDNLDHEILKEKWCKVLRYKELPIDQYKIFRSLTKYSYVVKDSVLRHFGVNLRKKKRKKEEWNTLLDLIPNTEVGKGFKEKFDLLRKRRLVSQNKPKKNGSLRGIPQGSSMSATLANLYLVDFDQYFNSLGKKDGFVYRRYCDDILVICETPMATNLESTIKDELSAYSLTIQDKKTEIIEFKKNSKGDVRGFNKKLIDKDKIELIADNEQKYYRSLQYLGFEFNGKNVLIRPGSLSRYFRKMKGRITKTVMMAKGKKSLSEKVFRKQIYSRYTHLGKSNFLTYAYRSSLKYYKNSDGLVKEGFDSKSIRKQLLAHFSILKRELNNTERQFD